MAGEVANQVRVSFLPFFVLIVVLTGSPAGATLAQDATAFPGLIPTQRVYDETGASLDPQQVAGLERQIADLAAAGADVIVYVRALEATPDETLDQVEALQQAWVARTGANQDTAVAILINRDPDDPNSARAGIFVGRTYNEGNVPDDEQRAIVEDALIPPLRNGDVHGSLSAALTRLESSILHGPPRNAFEKWAARVGDSWFPWANVVAAAGGGVIAALLFRQRQHLGQPELPPTTVRPGILTPALAAALAAGGPQATTFPATLLDLAGRGALTIEPESTGGVFSHPRIQVRLRDDQVVADDVEAAVWRRLEKRANVGVVSSKDLSRIAANDSEIRKVLNRQMTAAGWKDRRATSRKVWIGVVLAVAAVLAVFSFLVATGGQTLLPLIGVAAWVALLVVAIVMLLKYSQLSLAGQEAARPWRAYREGLKDAAKDPMVALDLDAVLPDVVAFDLGSAIDKRLEDAAEAGAGLRIFQATVGAAGAGAAYAAFPYWSAFTHTTAPPSSSGGTVSGGGAGGGGGAAGST